LRCSPHSGGSYTPWRLFDALRLLRGADCLQAFDTERLQALAMLYLRARFDRYHVGLLFCGLASTVCGYLWFNSGTFLNHWRPGVWLVCILRRVHFRFHYFSRLAKAVNLWWFDAPMGIFDLATRFLASR